MRPTLIQQIKEEIENSLRQFLREEGIELYIAANDNQRPAHTPLVELESIDDKPLHDNRLLSEIRVILSVLGKPWQSEVLVNGIYHALHPHHITHQELAVLLMSLHVETLHCVRPRHTLKKRAVMRYIVEETEEPAANENLEALPGAANAEYC